MGVLTSVATGSQTATGGEDVLFSDAGENFKYHSVKAYLDAMVSGDQVVIKIYDWDKVAGAYKLYAAKTVNNAPTNTAWWSPNFPAHQFKVTLTQSAQGAGGLKTFNWERLSN